MPVVRDGTAVQYRGSGYDGQFPIVLPELDLVIACNAWNIHEPPPKHTWRAVREILVPAAHR